MPANAIFAASSEKTVLTEGSLRRHRDRVLNRLKMGMFIMLIFSVLETTFFVKMAKAQISNELCFQDLTLKFLRSQTKDFRDVTGFTTTGLLENIVPVKSSPYTLEIGVPDVMYERLPGKRFLRTMEMNLIFRDSSEHEYNVIQTDTLRRKEIRQARKTKYAELRGEDPRFVPKYLVPALMIGAGISGIISLFYIRSS